MIGKRTFLGVLLATTIAYSADYTANVDTESEWNTAISKFNNGDNVTVTVTGNFTMSNEATDMKGKSGGSNTFLVNGGSKTITGSSGGDITGLIRTMENSSVSSLNITVNALKGSGNATLYSNTSYTKIYIDNTTASGGLKFIAAQGTFFFEETGSIAGYTELLGAKSQLELANGIQLTMNGSFEVGNNAVILGSGTLELPTTGLDLNGITYVQDATISARSNISESSSVGFILRNGTLKIPGNYTINAYVGLNSDSSYPLYGAIDVPSGYSPTISSQIEGSRLTKKGLGTLNLSYENNYAGGTIIQEGRLIPRNNKALGSGAITMYTGSELELPSNVSISNPISLANGNGTVYVNSGEATLAGEISGIGAFYKKGAGKLILTAANTFTGTLSVEGGILQAKKSLKSPISLSSGAQLLGDFSVPISLQSGSSTLQTGTYSGVISGSGQVQVNGTITLSGINTYTGGTSIPSLSTAVGNNNSSFGTGSIYLLDNDSTLQIGNGMSVSNAIQIDSAGIIAVNSGETGTITRITGGGNIEKEGDGTLIFQNGSYTIQYIEINHGTVQLNYNVNLSAYDLLDDNVVNLGAVLRGERDGTNIPYLLGNVNLLPQATLSGSIEIDGKLTAAPGSTVTVGNSIGYIFVDTLDLGSGSLISFFLDGDESSFLSVTNALEIGDDVTLSVLVGENFIQPQTIDSLAGFGSLTGTFTTLTFPSPLLTGNLIYGANTIELQVDYVDISNLGLEGNAASVGTAIDEILSENPSLASQIMPQLVSFGTVEAVDAALNEMQPALYKAGVIVQENNMIKVQDAVMLRMKKQLNSSGCCKLEEDPFHIWANGFGETLFQKSVTYASSPQIGYNETMGGVVTGFDVHCLDVLYFGALGAYTSSDIKWQQGFGKGHIESGYAGIYASAIGKMFYGNISFIGSWNHFNEHRNMSFPLRSFTANNRHGGAQFLAHADTGINFHIGNITLRPFNSFSSVAETENAFEETGAENLDLYVKKSSSMLLRNELGIDMAGCFCIRSTKWLIAPKLSWVREVRTKGSHYTAEFIDTNVPFVVTGYFPDRSMISPGVSITGSMMGDLLTLSLYYNGVFKGGYSEQSYGGELRFGF